MHKTLLGFLVLFPLALLANVAADPTIIGAHFVREMALQPGDSHDYVLQLRGGESAEVVIRQQGVDVAVELRSPGGALLDVVDGPTGRNGDEVLEIIAAQPGIYGLRVRPFDANEPADKYTLTVTALRSARATTALLGERRDARRQAGEWLRKRGAALSDPAPFDELANRARLIGLGEATHGSREFGDVRLALTRRLIERHGYRLVAVEASATNFDSGWIGGRARRELLAWTGAWNAAHPDDRMVVIGVDPQDNGVMRKRLRAFIAAAYGESVLGRWNETEKELAAADEQAAVFGDSSVDLRARQFLLELLAMIDLDAPILRPRLGAEAVEAAREAARNLAQFADFNASARETVTHSRDWAMAANVLRALESAGPASRAVYWAHNAHVAAPRSRETAGALFRAALGCRYGALAVTFGEGAFVAQIPNDLQDRLAVSTLPVGAEETIEAVMMPVAGGVVATWPCDVDLATAPAWLRRPQLMHWVGGLWAPGSLPSSAFRSFDLLNDFQGVVLLPRVTAEEMPADRPVVPPRRRP